MYVFEEKQDELLIIGQGDFNNKQNIFMTRYNEQFNYVLFSKAVALSVYPTFAVYPPTTYPFKFVLHPSEDYVFIAGYSEGWTSNAN